MDATLPLMLSYLSLGLAVGFFAGLLGIGGGAIMVPLLTMLFMQQHFPEHHLVHLALGTSMAAIIITSLSSLRSHHQHRAVRWDIVKTMVMGILLGTFSLSLIASKLSPSFLVIFFSVFMALIAIQMFLNRQPKASRSLPSPMALSAVGFGIGGCSALVGIGGGSLHVPFLTWCNVHIKHAIGTSAALGLPSACAGALGYMCSGWGEPDLPAYSLGYVYLPAVLLIAGTSVFTAPLGAALAHKLPVALLKKIFAGILLLLAIKMLQVVL